MPQKIKTPVAITGTTSGVEDNQILTVTLNGKTYTATVTSNAWTISVPAADAQVLPATNAVTADVSDVAGNPAVQATHTVAHDAIAPTIVINAIATDDIINATEDQSPVAITGTTSGVADNQIVTVTLNGKTYNSNCNQQRLDGQCARSRCSSLANQQPCNSRCKRCGRQPSGASDSSPYP